MSKYAFFGDVSSGDMKVFVSGEEVAVNFRDGKLWIEIPAMPSLCTRFKNWIERMAARAGLTR